MVNQENLTVRFLLVTMRILTVRPRDPLVVGGSVKFIHGEISLGDHENSHGEILLVTMRYLTVRYLMVTKRYLTVRYLMVTKRSFLVKEFYPPPREDLLVSP